MQCFAILCNQSIVQQPIDRTIIDLLMYFVINLSMDHYAAFLSNPTVPFGIVGIFKTSKRVFES